MAYTINGQAYDFSEPIEEGGVTFVPLAGIVETLGGYVYWNNQTKEAIVEFGDQKYSVTAGDTNLLGGDEIRSLSAAPEIKSSHLYVPIDFFEGTGCTVEVSDDSVAINRSA